MSWEPKNARWWKMYRRKRYIISCRQLHAPPTKEGSYKEANAWWQAKQAEIDGQQPRIPSPENSTRSSPGEIGCSDTANTRWPGT